MARSPIGHGAVRPEALAALHRAARQAGQEAVTPLPPMDREAPAWVNGPRGRRRPRRGHLDALLVARAKVRPVKHHAALPWDELPAFLADLRRREAGAARALEFTILTAARSGEVRGLRWAEIDLEASVWTVSAERMKASGNIACRWRPPPSTCFAPCSRSLTGQAATCFQARRTTSL